MYFGARATILAPISVPSSVEKYGRDPLQQARGIRQSPTHHPHGYRHVWELTGRCG